jgi:hypothetical protein
MAVQPVSNRGVPDEATPRPVSPSARLHVIRGERPRQFLFSAEKPMRVVVGSEPGADLCLRGPEVAPRQLHVVWDGRNLWLEDALRLGRTFVNGQLLNEWVAIVGQAVVSFGPVRLWVLAEGVAPEAHVPDFYALEHARVVAPESGVERRRNTARLTLPPELIESWKEREGAA